MFSRFLLDKTKQTFSNLGSKIKGQNHKTVDEDFNKMTDSFYEQKKKIDSVTNDIVAFTSAIEVLLQSQEKSAEHLRTLFPDDSNSNVNRLILLQINMLDKMKEDKKKLDTQIDTDFSTPVHSYLTQYREIDDRIHERKRRREKMDGIHDKLDKYTEKDDVRKNSEELKLKYAQEAYDDLTTEMMEDIPKLMADIDNFFTPIMHNLIFIQTSFWNIMMNYSNELTTTTNITSTQPIQIEHVITPRDQSSVVRTYSSMSNPYENNPNNPYQKNQPQNTLSVQQQNTQQPLPPLPSRGGNRVQAEAQWDFVAQNQNELSFVRGERLTILEQTGDWWKAENIRGGQGLIPGNYVKV